ncbi:MAG: anti-sigma factor family protein [Clostridia bacterium]
MNCLEIQELLSDYVDGLLPKDIASMLNKHLSKCSVCKNEYEKLKNILKECRKIEPVNLPPNFQTLLHESLVRERNNRLFWKRSIRGIAGSAAAILVLLFAFQFSSLVDGRTEKSPIHSSPEIFEASPAEYSIYADVEEDQVQESSDLFRGAESDRLAVVPEEEEESIDQKEEDAAGTAGPFSSLQDEAATTAPSDSLKETETEETGYATVRQNHKAFPGKSLAIGVLWAVICLIATGGLLYGTRLLWKRKGG